MECCLSSRSVLLCSRSQGSQVLPFHIIRGKEAKTVKEIPDYAMSSTKKCVGTEEWPLNCCAVTVMYPEWSEQKMQVGGMAVWV